MLADSYGRKLTLFICALGGLLQCLLVWLLPATALLGLGWFEVLTAASCVVSFSGGWSVALATSFAVRPSPWNGVASTVCCGQVAPLDYGAH